MHMKPCLWIATIIGILATGCSCLRSPSNSVEVRRIDHVALHVKDLNQSAEFYLRTLGFKVIHRWNTTWMVGNDRIRIGLFQRPNATPIDNPDDRIVLEHFALLVKNQKEFDRAVNGLDRLGVKHEDTEDTGIAKSIFFRDPDGHSVEITFYYQKKPAT
jgi:catechol 2,3-dioxygenase-like lactoylglutathione lyase family enzyme